MALPQDISPVNSELMDSLCKTDDMDWIPMQADPERGFMKVLWTGPETGAWAALFRWYKGYVAPPHKHLSPAHVYVLSGKLQVRDGILEAGDYVYEPNGMVHGSTTALEDTDYLFICNGPVLFFDDNNFTSYLGWEELCRIQEEYTNTAGSRHSGESRNPVDQMIPYKVKFVQLDTGIRRYVCPGILLGRTMSYPGRIRKYQQHVIPAKAGIQSIK